jgi:hypothetical protein
VGLQPRVFAAYAAGGLVIFAGLAYWRATSSPTPAAFVGSSACGSCHAEEYRAWQPSQHALAMQPAQPGTVLGNFKDASFTYANVTSTFSQRDGQFWANTDGPDGRVRDFELKYTFGVYPLQQYLVELSGGRLQAASAGFICTPTKRSPLATNCIGRDETRTGTSCARIVTRQTSGKGTTHERMATRRPGVR